MFEDVPQQPGDPDRWALQESRPDGRTTWVLWTYNRMPTAKDLLEMEKINRQMAEEDEIDAMDFQVQSYMDGTREDPIVISDSEEEDEMDLEL